ncbi:hypothetical protein BH10ACI4_BH10ACI4_15630 [soil metagenome]
MNRKLWTARAHIGTFIYGSAHSFHHTTLPLHVDARAKESLRLCSLKLFFPGIFSQLCNKNPYPPPISANP